MKANGKLLLLDMAKATKYMYKSWAIGSLTENCNRIVPDENVAVESLMPSWIFFHYYFFISGFSTCTVCQWELESRDCSVPLLRPFRSRGGAGRTRSCSLTFFHRNWSFLRAGAAAKQDKFCAGWQELSWSGSENVRTPRGRVQGRRGSGCCRRSAFTWHVYKTVYISKV